MYLFLFIILGYVIFKTLLLYKQLNHLNKQKLKIPSELLGNIDYSEYIELISDRINEEKKAAKNFILPSFVLFLWLYAGGLNFLDASLRQLELSELITGLMFLISIGIFTELLNIAYYILNKIRYIKLIYIKSVVKNKFKILFFELILNILLIIPLLWFVYETGPFWWVYTWIITMVFFIFHSLIYPKYIIQYKKNIQPLDNVEIVNGIAELHQKIERAIPKIYTYHTNNDSFTNAFISGFSKTQSIFLDESLLKELNSSQVIAIYAHELGHSVNHHIEKSIFVTSVTSLFGFYFLSFLLGEEWFFINLGIETPSKYIALQMFIMLSPIFLFFIYPLQSCWLKKQEQEADDYAVSIIGKELLVDSLIALHKKNGMLLSNDYTYSLFYDSHPSLVDRIKGGKLRPPIVKSNQ